MTDDRCLWCRAKLLHYRGKTKVFNCGTKMLPGGTFIAYGEDCLRRQLDAVTKERDEAVRRVEAVKDIEGAMWTAFQTDDDAALGSLLIELTAALDGPLPSHCCDAVRRVAGIIKIIEDSGCDCDCDCDSDGHDDDCELCLACLISAALVGDLPEHPAEATLKAVLRTWQQFKNSDFNADSGAGSIVRDMDGLLHGVPLPSHPTVGCYDCGLPYGGNSWVEAVVPDHVWNQIKPDGCGDGCGLLCIACMARRIAESGIGDVPAWLCGTEPLIAQQGVIERTDVTRNWKPGDPLPSHPDTARAQGSGECGIGGDLQEFACRISDLIWGGECAWDDGEDGLKLLAIDVQRRISPPPCRGCEALDEIRLIASPQAFVTDAARTEEIRNILARHDEGRRT